MKKKKISLSAKSNSFSDSQDITTIKISRQTKQRLEKLRVYKRESYEEILQKMLEILNTCRAHPDIAQKKLLAIERQIREHLPEALQKENY